MGKIAVHAKLTAAEGKGDDVVAAFSSLYDGPLDAETGCEVHVIHQAKDNPDVVFFYELYSDDAAFAAHGQGEALRAVFPKLAGLLSGAPEMVIGEPKQAKGLTP
jgi:quinol monooxygenase YgiN